MLVVVLAHGSKTLPIKLKHIAKQNSESKSQNAESEGMLNANESNMNLELSRKNSESRNHKNVAHVRNQLERLKSKKAVWGLRSDYSSSISRGSSNSSSSSSSGSSVA